MGITKEIGKKLKKENPNEVIAGNEETGHRIEQERESPALGMVHTLRPRPLKKKGGKEKKGK